MLGHFCEHFLLLLGEHLSTQRVHGLAVLPRALVVAELLGALENLVTHYALVHLLLNVVVVRWFGVAAV